MIRLKPGLQYEVLVEGEIVFSSSDMDTAVRKYNELVPHSSESEDWIALHKVYKTTADGRARERRSSLLECNKKPVKKVQRERPSLPKKCSHKVDKWKVREILGGMDYMDAGYILALRKYAEDQGHCNVPEDDSDHKCLQGLGRFVEHLKKAYREDSNHPLVSKVIQVVPESRHAIHGQIENSEKN